SGPRRRAGSRCRERHRARPDTPVPRPESLMPRGGPEGVGDCVIKQSRNPMYSRRVTVPTLDSEPDCARPTRRLIAERRSFDSISRDTWDRIAGLNPWATPFSSWGFHRAWWDAYGENAHDQTLVVL